MDNEDFGLTAQQWAGIGQLATDRSPALEYMYDPVGWWDAYLRGFPPNGYQKDVLNRLVDRRRVAAYGPHGMGKTGGMAAPAVLWFATTREAARVEWLIITTASVNRQLSKFLWPNIHRCIKTVDFDALGVPRWERSKKELLDQAIKLNWGQAMAASSEDPDKVEGGHAKSLLVIFDEAKAIPANAWDAFEGAFANAGDDTDSEAFALAVSTPGSKDSRFYDICSDRKKFAEWDVRHVPVVEAIAEGRVSAEWVENKRLQWGETSAVFINKCLGEFTETSSEGFVPYEWIEDAHRRWHALNAKKVFENVGARTIGLDPARTGVDKSLKAHYLPEFDAVWKLTEEEYTPNLAVLGRETAHETQGGRLVVDAAGLGAGVYDAAVRLGVCEAVEFQPAASTLWRDATGLMGANNKRTAANCSVRDRLNPNNDPTLALPEDDEMVGDLLAQRLAPRLTDINLFRLAPKLLVKKDLGRSPDRSDALTYALWVDPKPRPFRARRTVNLLQEVWPEAG